MPPENEQLAVFNLTAEELPAVPSDVESEPEPMVCPCCSAEIAEGDEVEHDGEPHCADCVHTCEECNYTTTDENYIHSARERSSRRSSTQELCESCAFQCADCNEWFSNRTDTGTNAAGEKICGPCAAEYFTCDSCNDVVHQDNAHSDGEQTYCESCYEERESEDDSLTYEGETVIHDHWHKPAPKFYGAGASIPVSRPIPGAVYFGCEIEVDAHDHIDRVTSIVDAGLHPNTFYHCETDGSLSARGFEIVSKPATWEHWQTVDMEWMESLRNDGFRSYDTDSCGMHVHVSRSFFNEDSLASVCLFVKHNATLIKRLSRRSGGESSYARLETGGIQQIEHKIKTGPATRYEAINLENATTIEFRFFRGTLNAASFRRNLSLVVAISHFAKWSPANRFLTAERFALWVRTKGKKILGAYDAKALSIWIEEAIAKQPAADVAA